MPISDPTVDTSSGNSSDAALTMPASSEEDRLLLWIEFEGGTEVSPSLSGWVQVARQDYQTVLGLVAYQKEAIAAEPASYTVNLGSARGWTGGIAAYPGAGQIQIQVGRADQYSRRQFSTEAITSASDNNRIVAIAAQGAPVREWTPPTGWALRGSQQTGSNVRVDISSALIDIPQATAGGIAAANIEAAVGSSILALTRGNGIRNSIQQSVAMRAQWQALGFTDIQFRNQDTNRATIQSDAAARDLTIILGELSSGRLAGDIDNLDAPVVCAESGNWDDVLMADGTLLDEPDSGTVNIIDSAHPMAGGNPDGITPVTNPIFQRSNSGFVAATKIVATHVDTGNPIFMYVEKGDTNTQGGEFPYRIAGVGVHESATGWTSEGSAILNGCIDWAVRAKPSPQLIIMAAVPEAATTEQSVVGQDGTTPAPEFSRPTASQIHSVSISSAVTPAPELGAAVATQNFSATASSVSTLAPALNTPTASQLFNAIAASPAIDPPILSAPTASQQHVVSAESATTPDPILSDPSADQNVSVSALSVTGPAPELSRPTARQDFSAIATDVVAPAPVLGAPSVIAAGVVNAEDIVASDPILSDPTASQQHNVVGDSIAASAPMLGRPAVDQQIEISASSIEASSPELSAPAARQILTVSDVVIQVAAPELNSPAASQHHEVQASSVSAPNPILGAPTIIATGVVSAEDPPVPEPILSDPTASQHHDVDVPSVNVLPPILNAPTASLPPTTIQLNAPFSITTKLTRPTADQLFLIQGLDVTTPNPELSAPIASISTVADGADATAPAPELNRPTASQAFEIVASSITTPAPILGSPTVLAEGDVSAIEPEIPAPVFSKPTVFQIFDVNATSVVAPNPELSAPIASRTETVVAESVSASVPIFNKPTASQVFEPAAVSPTTSPPSLSAPTASQAFSVQGLDGLSSAPELSKPTAGQILAVSANSVIAGAPELAKPTANVAHQVFAFDVIGSAPILSIAIAEDASIPFNIVAQSVISQNPIFNLPTASQAENFITPLILIQAGSVFIPEIGVTVDSHYDVEVKIETESTAP